MNKHEIMSGFREAANITRRSAGNFYFASLFLPKEIRYAAYSIYSVCRISDETLDSYSSSVSEDLEKLKNNIYAVYTDAQLQNDLFFAFRHTVRKYNISLNYFHALIDGMRLDITKTRYADFSELYDYCYKVAGVVGLVMLKIFGYDNDDAETYALDLGIAMQLTNIIRDIKEDLKRDRIYIPQEELARYGISEEDLKKENLNEGFREMLKMQIKRAREYYSRSSPGIKMIKKPSCRYVSGLMKEFYERILKDIENKDYDIFSGKAHVSGMRKTFIAARALIKKEYL
ncbi:MAG: phytoene/squalene synthase family protein [Candidatus Omnitrophota bacterium]